MPKDKTNKRLQMVRFMIYGLLLILGIVILNSCAPKQPYYKYIETHQKNVTSPMTLRNYPMGDPAKSKIIINTGLDTLRFKPLPGKKYTITIAEEK